MASEKQIAWATKIRTDKLAEIEKFISDECKPDMVPVARHGLELIEKRGAESHAEFWINKRSYDAEDLLEYALKREKDIRDAKNIIAGESDPLDFPSKRLSDFLQLIDAKSVSATRIQREAIYRAMVKIGDAEHARDATIAQLKHEQYNDHGKHNYSKEWCDEMTVKIDAAKSATVRSFVK